MKFFAVFSALLAVACASNSNWSLAQLSEAINSPYTDAALKPHLINALDNMMAALWAGQQIESVTVSIPSVDFSTWTVSQLGDAIQNPETDPALLPLLEEALNHMMEALFTETPVVAAALATPAMEIHYYTLNDLSVALQDPTTNPELMPYLEQALNHMMDALFAGEQMTFTVIAVPAGLKPVDAPTEVVPAPADNEIIVPETPSPVVPSPAAANSPLVQLIININQQ